jgi:thioester reductase-like protein
MNQTIPAPQVEAAIAAVAARCLRAPARFDPDTPFALMGIDSLASIEMAAALEESLGRRLPPDLLLDCADARALAVRIATLRAAEPSAEDPFDQLLADSVLPDDVRPAHAARSTDLRAARRILLTGSTGFLGRALLGELLHSTSAAIVCLVRNAHSARATVPGATNDRLHLVNGDLAQPLVGLTPAQFDDLAGNVDAIVHCGAAVNWVYGYSGLRAANVAGTRELLRLACAGAIPFHFISSLSVCYSTLAPRSVDESFDPLPSVRGVHFGYAQTKIAAEALVSEARRRGLPARIYRPPLISGDSRTGTYNRDDLVSALVRGCVHMGTAPDLDWKLDCQPVDFVAASIVRLSAERGPVFHLAHERPRHWRECVLWMRMYGYPLRLVPYHAWLRQLDRETRVDAPGGASHPLRPLRTFFLDRRSGTGLTLPELHDETRRTQARSTMTLALLPPAPALDASLLETYFAAFRASGDMPDPARREQVAKAPQPGERTCTSPAFLSELLNRDVRRATVVGAGSDHSIISELTAWRSGRDCGLFHLAVELADGCTFDVRLKAKAADEDVIAVGESLSALVDAPVGETHRRWSDRIGLATSHHREIEIYRQTDPRFVAHAPALLGSIRDDARRIWTLALENVRGGVLMDAADDSLGWTSEHIAAVLDGLAALHAIWYGREAELRRLPWIGYVQSVASMVEMRDLWTALARHAAPSFSSWARPEIGAVQQQLIDTIACWWPSMESGPRTLIHNDFNPRNLCLRDGRLLAYDWELATVGAPQRDLAEFLTFVLPPDVRAAELQQWIEHHRLTVERTTGASIHTGIWQTGFRAALYELLINRFSMYAVVDRVRRQPFLPRVVRTWWRLFELTREESW